MGYFFGASGILRCPGRPDKMPLDVADPHKQAPPTCIFMGDPFRRRIRSF